MARDSGLASASEQRLIADRYRPDALLGKGGMGAVYRATDVATGQVIALKTMLSAASPKALELFRREYHTLHGLRHPNIIEVYDYGTTPDGPFYTMELLEGRDLSAAAPLPWRDVCSHLRQVAALLALLHARRLLHRDLSPRNIWVLPDGRLKLIDFGALAPFGPPADVVGTPAFIAPEAFAPNAAVSIDQRADLYALGALGYWLLTSVHAYPAKSLHDLAWIWSREPAAPSSLARLVENLPPVPLELDALIASLLRRDPAARPETTEMVIDRIDAIAGPAAEPVGHAVHGYVRSKAFVGRSGERREIEQALKARAGRALLVESAAGLGRSRLLEEASVLARLAGATSVLVRADERTRAYGVANALALGLLRTLTQEAAAAAAPHANTLAQLSPELRRQLGANASSATETGPRAREQLQHALTEWVLALAKPRMLVLLIDDLEECDEESAAWLAALAHGSAARSLLLMAALVREPGLTPPLHMQMYRNAARVLELPPLTAAETHELLHSVFGPAAYLGRVAQSLHQASQGSPAHCLDLVEQLVERGLLRYSEGTWSLPGQLSDADLPRSRDVMHAARLTRLSLHARSFAELLSIHEGRLTRAECDALSELSAEDSANALVELTLSGVLNESEHGYAFSHASAREAAGAALDPERGMRAHGRLARVQLASAHDPVDALHAALHCFYAGDLARSEQLVRDAVRYIFAGHRERLHFATPLLERWVALNRARAAGPGVLLIPLAALAMASFYVDRRLADRYGAEAVDGLEAWLCFDSARTLRGWLGAKLALFAALGQAGARARIQRSELRVPEALRLLLGSVIALNGVAVASFDLPRTVRCAHALEPIAVLGDRNVAGFIRRCLLSITALLSSDHSAALRELRAIAQLMESGAEIRGLPADLKHEFLPGCLFSIGVLESWRIDPAALAIAERIESFGPMHALNADHLRANYYWARGDSASAELYWQRVETRALQLGAAWQIVTMGPIDSHICSLWTQDARVAKRAAAELERLSQDLPSLREEARRARATYLVLCGRYREAIAVMQASTAHRGIAGWARSQGMLARAHNRLGEHAGAKALCQEALLGWSDDDLMFVTMSLHVQLEYALADAGLGNFAVAHARLARLCELHADAGPLALGALHETRARVALLERDFEACRAHLAAMRAAYAPTKISSLIELANLLDERATRSERGAQGDAAPRAALLAADDAHLYTRMQLILAHTEASFERRAQRGLQIALELSGAQTGFVLSAAAESGVVFSGETAPDPELVRWAEAQLHAEAAEEHTEILGGFAMEDEGTNVYEAGEISYCAVPLFRSGASERAAMALVLGFRGGEPRPPQAEVLAVLATHLLEL